MGREPGGHKPRFPTLSKREWSHVTTVLGLTKREADIVWLILKCRRDKEIASDLRVSVATVRTHLRHIFVRARVMDRVELVLSIWEMLRHKRPDGEHHQK
jgi:DNA-binding CsgD family transcriptional regulator